MDDEFLDTTDPFDQFENDCTASTKAYEVQNDISLCSILSSIFLYIVFGFTFLAKLLNKYITDETITESELHKKIKELEKQNSILKLENLEQGLAKIYNPDQNVLASGLIKPF